VGLDDSHFEDEDDDEFDNEFDDYGYYERRPRRGEM
jgi:hypothetical protein